MYHEMTFDEAVAGLLTGDFTRLAPLFDSPDKSSCLVIRWFEEGCFSREPKALAEAFTCACFNGRSRVIRYLLDRGVDPCGGTGTGLNAFHWAANRGQKEAVEMLIQSGAPLEIPNAYGGSVLGSAVWAAVHESKPDHLSIIQSLLEAGAKVEGADFPSGSDQVDALLHRYRTPHHPDA